MGRGGRRTQGSLQSQAWVSQPLTLQAVSSFSHGQPPPNVRKEGSGAHLMSSCSDSGAAPVTPRKPHAHCHGGLGLKAAGIGVACLQDSVWERSRTHLDGVSPGALKTPTTPGGALHGQAWRAMSLLPCPSGCTEFNDCLFVCLFFLSCVALSS